MKTDTEVVIARPADVTQIAVMSRELVEQGLRWRWTARRVGASIRNPDHNVAVVRNQHTLAGFGIMEYGLDAAHLLLFAVRPDERRRGIGSRILRWLEETAVVAGIEAIYLETRRGNRGARHFYLAHGYQDVALLRGYYDGRESAVRMMRRLRPSELEHPPTPLHG